VRGEGIGKEESERNKKVCLVTDYFGIRYHGKNTLKEQSTHTADQLWGW